MTLISLKYFNKNYKVHFCYNPSLIADFAIYPTRYNHIKITFKDLLLFLSTILNTVSNVRGVVNKFPD